MNLAAYLQIDDLDGLAKANGIEVPRLRGYELMAEKKPISADELAGNLRAAEMQAYKDYCEARPVGAMNPRYFEYSSETKRIKDRYLLQKAEMRSFNGETYEVKNTVGFRWDKLHGKRRKVLKYLVKKAKRRMLENVSAWNRYAGRSDVLYIHARIGGNNWRYYGGEELSRQPWFIERVDDPWDSTYCDIYARIADIRPEPPKEELA